MNPAQRGSRRPRRATPPRGHDPMALTRVRRGALPRCLAGALLLAGSALWEPAAAQYNGFGFPFFWVGLPPAKNIRDVDIGFLNDVFRERAEKDGIGYIDVWDAFVDEDGDFSMRGPDVNGQTRLLRAADGLNFTKQGARKLALYLEREISRTVLHPAPAEPSVATRETTPLPVKPNERPIAGPVVPLTEAPPVKGDALLGAASTAPADARLLGGEPAAPARGRADDFSWPRAQEAPAVVQEGPGYAQEGSGGVPRSSKPSARDSSRKSGENAH